MATATERQEIPIIRDTRPRVEYVLPDGERVQIIHDHGEVPQPTISYSKHGEVVIARRADLVPDEAARIIALLDAARALNAYISLTIWASHYADGIAEYALRLWASANNLALNDKVEQWESATCRVISVAGYETSISLQFDSLPRSVAREPAPGVKVEVPVEGANVIVPPAEIWRPADPVDDASTRFSLMEIE